MPKGGKMFDFDRSIPIGEAFGCGCHGPNGWENLHIKPLGRGEEKVIPVAEIQLVVSKRLGKSTGHPCFDPETDTIGFPDETTLQRYKEHWNITVH